MYVRYVTDEKTDKQEAVLPQGNHAMPKLYILFGFMFANQINLTKPNKFCYKSRFECESATRQLP